MDSPSTSMLRAVFVVFLGLVSIDIAQKYLPGDYVTVQYGPWILVGFAAYYALRAAWREFVTGYERIADARALMAQDMARTHETPLQQGEFIQGVSWEFLRFFMERSNARPLPIGTYSEGSKERIALEKLTAWLIDNGYAEKTTNKGARWVAGGQLTMAEYLQQAPLPTSNNPF